MKNLKQLLRNRFAVLISALVLGHAPAWAGFAQDSGGNFIITKDLPQVTGTPYPVGGIYSAAFGWGEQISGFTITDGITYELISGYYGGRFGNSSSLQIVRTEVAPGARAFFQDGVQVGVPLQATVQIDFSDQLDNQTLAAGIQVFIVTDHMGRPQNTPVPFLSSYDPVNQRVILSPASAWLGNTLYDVTLTPSLLSIDGFTLNSVTHIQFVTLLDPHVENVVLRPVPGSAGASASGSGTAGSLNVHIPSESLADYSMILFSPDPIKSPLRVDPQIVQDANQKATVAGGPYRTPIVLQEITAYNTQGNVMGVLSAPAEISMTYEEQNGLLSASPAPIRAPTLALWVLDETHRLWVKMPESHVETGRKTVSASVNRFAVFALMGSASASAADAFVFPVPWRPHGPNAGTGAGQTGTTMDGMTFTSLPSECTIKIFTLSGELVRELRHSDTAGPTAQEKWDGNSTHGDHAASGVYLWRVESATDAKNGKLMVIR